MSRPPSRSTPALALSPPGDVGSRPGTFASARNVAAHSVGLDPTRAYCAEGAYEFLVGAMLDVELIAPTVEGKFMSALSRVGTPSA